MAISGTEKIGGTDSIYKAYFWGLCKGISLENMAWKMVRYLHFRILKFPVNQAGWVETNPQFASQAGALVPISQISLYGL